MNTTLTRQLTGHIALRLWLVVVLVGAAGLGLMWLGVRLGLALATIAILAAPIAVVSTVAWVTRRKATVIPRWLLWLGVAGTAVGFGWLILQPGEVPAILTLAVGVWLLVVGLISSVVVGRTS